MIFVLSVIWAANFGLWITYKYIMNLLGGPYPDPNRPKKPVIFGFVFLTLCIPAILLLIFIAVIGDYMMIRGLF